MPEGLMKGLLIIDMQAGSFKPPALRFDADHVVKRINSLSNQFRQNGDKVIFIQHDGTKENYLFPGTPDWEILPSLVRCQDDTFVFKSANDSFYGTDLESILKKSGINDVYITGCATDFCVNATIHGALTRNLNVVVVKDCHTTANRPHLDSKKIIEYHNWLWENLTPTGGVVRTALSHDLLGKV